jgi:exoribonuclease R
MKKEIKAFFSRNPNRGFKAKEVAQKIGITSDHEYSSLKAALYKLEEEKFLIRIGKRFQLNKSSLSNKLKGKLEINRNGFGFVIIKAEKLKMFLLLQEIWELHLMAILLKLNYSQSKKVRILKDR